MGLPIYHSMRRDQLYKNMCCASWFNGGHQIRQGPFVHIVSTDLFNLVQDNMTDETVPFLEIVWNKGTNHTRAFILFLITQLRRNSRDTGDDLVV